MAIYNFGAGTLWGVPSGTNPTPVQFGVLQEATVDIKSTNKELFGGYQYPVAVGRGTSKITGKAKFGQLQASASAQLFFGQTPGTTQTTTANNEAQSVPAVSTYTVTVTNAATYVSDLGVRYSATGLPLKRVASVSAVGQYSVNTTTGVYTFYSGDASAAVLISYKYTVSTGGQLLSVPNALIGTAPTFSITLESVYSTGKSVLTLNNCISESFNFGTKLEDFAIPEFDFAAFADSSGNVMSWNFNDLS